MKRCGASEQLPASLKQAFDKVDSSTHKSTYAALLRKCTELGLPLEGNCLADKISECGLQNDTLLGNLLVQMHGSFGALQRAQETFEGIRFRNVFSWTILLGAFAENGQLGLAFSVFKRMPERNVVSWNSLISGCAQHGDDKMALLIFRTMILQGEQVNRMTLLGVLDACSAGGPELLSEGRRIHEIAEEAGLIQDEMVQNSLVRVYGKCGSIAEATAAFQTVHSPHIVSWNSLLAAYGENGLLAESERLFDAIPQRSVVTWNSMMMAYAQNEHEAETVDLFKRMDAEGIEANEASFVIVLDCCATNLLLESGREVHEIVSEKKLETDRVIGSLLVYMYGKCGSTQEAELVFNRLSHRRLISWNIMISAYSIDRKEKALQLFREMEIEGCQPDDMALVAVPEACDISSTQVILSSIEHRSDLTSSVFVRTAFLNCFARCRCPEQAREMFESICEKTSISWNSMLSAYAQNGGASEAWKIFQKMDLEGVEATAVSFIIMLETSTELSVDHAKIIHALISGSFLDSDLVICSALISAYSKLGDLPAAKDAYKRVSHPNSIIHTVMLTACSQNNELVEAEMIFRELIEERNVVAWNAMLTAYAFNGEDSRAWGLFLEMVAGGVMPDNVTLTTVLGCCSALTLERVEPIEEIIFGDLLSADEILSSALVKAYGRLGRIEEAELIFRDKMPASAPASWNVIIAAHAQNGLASGTMKLFRSMLLLGVRPNLITFATVVDVCSALPERSELAELLHSLIISSGLGGSRLLSNAVINLHGKCGNPGESLRVFGQMNDRCIVSWTSIISALCDCGDSAAAVEMFRSMKLEGVDPDGVTYVSLLWVLSHGGRLEPCISCFRSMQEEHGIRPMVEHYACVVDLLGRAGQLGKAEELIRSMPYEPGHLDWMMLLGASRTHSDLQRGTQAAGSVLEIGTPDPVAYILFSHFFEEHSSSSVNPTAKTLRY